jgi:hypothetical protein
MIDIETFGNGPSAPIVQIAAILFEAKSGGAVLNSNVFNAYIKDPVGEYDADTVAWWMGQSEQSRSRLTDGMKNGVKLHEALEALDQWPASLPVVLPSWPSFEGVWAKPTSFDLSILSSAYRMVGKRVPWHYRLGRDVGTVFWMLGNPPPIDDMGVAHDAVADCLWQICALQAVLGRLQ